MYCKRRNENGESEGLSKMRKIDMKYFLLRIIIDVIKIIRRKMINAGSRKKFNASMNDYNANLYWEQRHKQFGNESFLGVGHKGLSEEENFTWYASAKYIFMGILKDAVITKKAKILELGYGNGFYAQVCFKMGIDNYYGVDIVDQHAKGLRKKLPNYSFEKADIGTEKVACKECGVICMIDVSQHIVNDDKLRFCLTENVANNLNSGGVFIVTDQLTNEKKSFYEKTRTVEFYKSALKGFNLEQAPILFRDKYIMSFRKR